MKHWRMDLTPYPITLTGRNTQTGEEVVRENELLVGKVIAELLWKVCKWTADEAMAVETLSKRFEEANGSIEIDQLEYEYLQRVYRAVRGPGRQLLECLRRLRDMEEI